MDFSQAEIQPPQTLTLRHKCSACYKQYKFKDHLIEHMRISYHSVHQPQCGVCKKYCKSFESLREHTTGRLPKTNCEKIFSARGCDLCMSIFNSPDALIKHRETCCMSPAAPLDIGEIPYLANNFALMEISDVTVASQSNQAPQVVSMDCEMVGGGSDGSLDLCARVCLVDVDENVLFYSYVMPQIPVTNYRYEITGITEDHLKDAMPLKQVQEKVQEILHNGESIWKMRFDGGKAGILVGHGLEHDLCCLQMHYPDHLIRDTAQYPPLMKTNMISHSLKYLSKTYLGYDIQTGVHDPYEDCVATMRLYKRMRAQVHQPEMMIQMPIGSAQQPNIFDNWKHKELQTMSPDDLFEISRSKYKCWCLDSRQRLQS
ncbi:uncharacterized protein LOC143852781 [Tasmannia lanceolata]|uniref:uncharacterized protein LOC143852781 n=1 Tax=Tasmannia lanceolata TaxID=3420 RepID=UPI004064C7AE